MDDQNRDQGQLIDELDRLRRRTAELEAVASERSQAKETLKRLAAVVRDSNDAIIVQDIDGRITAWNRGAERMYGYSEAEALGMNIDQLSPPDKVSEQKEFTRRLIAGEAVTSFETQRVTKDGSILDVWLTVTKLVEDPADSIISTGRDITIPIGIALIERNITERKRAEEDLRKIEGRFRALVESSLDVTIVLNAQGNVIYLSPNFEKVWGFKAEGVLGQDLFKNIYPDDIPEIGKKFTEIIKNPKTLVRMQIRALYPDGTWHTLDSEARNHLDDPAIGGIVVNFHDVTELKRAEDALKEKERYFRSLIENSSDGIMVLDRNGKILYESASCSRLLGYSEGERIGQVVFDPIHPDDMHVLIDGLKRIDSDVVGPSEVRARHKDGSWHSFEVSATSFLDDPAVGGVVVNLRDITERKRAEEALKESDQLFKKLAYNVPGMIYQFLRRPDGTYCAPFSTDSIKDILGCSPEDVRDDFSPVTRVVLPEDLGKLVESIEYSAEHITPWQCEYRVQVPGKPVRWLLGQSMPEKLADGSVIWHGFNTDITDRKRMEYALRESEEKYSTLVENATDGVSIIQDQVIKFANRCMSEMSGYTVEELTEMSTFDLVPPDFTPVLEERFRLRAEGKEVPGIFETRMLCKDGTVKEMESSTKLTQYEGRPAVIAITRDVTERKRMEDALRESEEKYSTLVENAIECVTISRDEDKRILYANKRMAEVSGYSIEELLGMTVIDLIPPDFFPVLRERFRMRMEGQAIPDVLETRLLCKDGTIKEMETSTRLIEYRGSPSVMSINRDFTERRRMEEALRESEELHRALVEASGRAGICIAILQTVEDREASIVFANDQASTVLGYSKEELLNMSLGDVIPVDIIGQIMARYRERQQGKPVPYSYEAAIIRKDKTMVPVMTSVATTQIHGKPATVVYFRDITESKKWQDALRKSEEKYRLLADNASDVIMLMDMTAKPVYFSPSVTRLLGYSVEEALIGSMEGRMTPASMEKAVKHFMAGLHRERRKPSGSAGQTLELEMIHKNGSIVVVEMMVSFIRDETGKPTGMMAILRDLTERKKAEKEIVALSNAFKAARDPIIIFDMQGNVVNANEAARQLFERYDVGANALEIVAQEDRDRIAEVLQDLISTGQPASAQFNIVTRSGRRILVEASGSVIRGADDKPVGIVVVERDLSERVQAEAHQKLAAEILGILNEPMALPDAINRILIAIKRETGFYAVGIRLRQGDDFPYFVQNGFSDDFLLTENTLVVRDNHGDVCRDKDGNVSLECTCGLVLSGKTDPSNPLFTPGGSAWTNDSPALLDVPLEQDPRLHPRNRCIHAGFQSVALMPIRSGNDIVGLLQLNDRRKGCFTPEMIRFFEGVAASIGVALMRKQADDALRESEERYRMFAENASDALWTMDMNFNLTYHSGGDRIFGYTAEEMLKRTVDQRMTPESVQPAFKILQEELDIEQLPDKDLNRKRAIEVVQYHKNGSIVHTEETVSFLRDENGKAIGIIGVSRDITERKRAEEALRESEIKYRDLFEHTLLGMEVVDAETGKIVLANHSMARMFEFKSPDEMVGVDAITDHILPEDMDWVLQQFAQSMADPDRKEVAVIRARTVNGRVIWVAGSTTSYKYEGKPAALISLIEVTAAKEAEEALTRINKAVESSSDAIGLSDAQGHHFYHNRAFTELFEYTPEELEAAGGGPAIYANKHVARKVFDTIMGGGSWSGEVEMVSKGGRGFTVFLRADAIKDENGKVIGLVGVHTDITERKKAEEKLRETRDYMENLIEHANVPMVVWTPDFRITRFNRAFERLTGMKAKAVIGKDLEILFPKGTRDRSMSFIRTAMRGARWEVVEIPIANVDGDVRMVLWNISPIYAEDGKTPMAIIAQGQDITERKQAEEALRESEELSRSMLESAAMGIYLLQNKKFIYVNPTFEKIVGYSSEELMGQEAINYVHPDDRDIVRTKSVENIQGASAQPYEFRALRKDGRQIWVMERVTPVRYKGRRAVLASFMETTEHKKAEVELERAYEDLKTMHENMVQSQKLRAMGEMASGIAHDFNNMLAVILGRTQLVIDDVKDDKVKKGIQVIEQAALDAAKTVKRLQDFARIRVEHPFEPLDVNEVAEGVLKMVESRRVELEQTKGIAIKVEQELGKVGRVSGDAAELREALLNILFNALDAMPSGGKLTVKTLQDEEWVQITIKDTGVGIPDKVKAKVFEPFFTTKSSKGSGLGLSVTYGIIARHGGMIKFDSEVGKGTAFYIRLPLSVEEVRKQARKSKVVSAKPASILTVDDEPEVLKALGLTLEYFGHWVKDFTSGAEAIKAFKDGKYDVVITDLGMPEVSGWDVARAIKKMKPEVPVLLISGWVIDLDEEQKKLVDGVIAKPFSRESIASAISGVFPARKKRVVKKKSSGKKKSTRTKKIG